MLPRPHVNTPAKSDPDYPDDVETPRHPKDLVRVKKAKWYKDPDLLFDQMVRTVETKVIGLNAKLVMGHRQVRESGSRTGRQLQIVHFPTFDKFIGDTRVKRRLHERFSPTARKEIAERLLEVAHTEAPKGRRRLREDGADAFLLGEYPDERSDSKTYFPYQDLSLPGLNTPYSRQQLLMDTLAMHARSFEAATRNPLGKRITRIIPQFVLGRGVKGSIGGPKYQRVWDSFWTRHQLRLRLKVLLRELITFGELFLRFFKGRDGLLMRSIDPSTIWDIISDPEDVEDVHYYHQQFTVLQPTYGLGGPRKPPVAPSTLIIRQIDAADLDHYKINSTSFEKRGRSELYAILSWLQRFKEFGNDRVLLNKMRAMFALDVSVEGGPGEMAAAEAQFATPPGAGAVIIHNKAVEVDFKNANNNANEAKTDAEMLLKIVAVGAGISEQFLGVSYAGSRAGALIQTEPDVKNFEDYREIVEEILTRIADRVWEASRLSVPDPPMEFTFPSIAQEERSSKIKDIAFSESMDYFSKIRAATMVAREFEITNYDYATEREAIRRERSGDDPQVIATGLQQQPKIAVDPAAALEDGPTPLLPERTSRTGGSKNEEIVQLGAEMGFAADKGGRGLPNTQATLSRDRFTRSGEREAIQGHKSSNTPLRHAAGGSGAKVWSDKARTRSLALRRRRKIDRLLREHAALAEQPLTPRLQIKLDALLVEVNNTRKLVESATEDSEDAS